MVPSHLCGKTSGKGEKGMRITAAALAMIGLTLMVGERSKAVAEDFYKGKTMTIICPFSAGGTYDRMSRLAAQYMPKDIRGEPTLKFHQAAGRGGMLGTRPAYKATPDG